jgi:hypothetical protein
MSTPFQHRYNSVAHEREIQSLSDRCGASPAEVQALFVPEFARLKMGARVGTYLAVLTESNVRGMLQRQARLAINLTTGPSCARSSQAEERSRWEDDGGAVRRNRRNRDGIVRGAPSSPTTADGRKAAV